IHLFWDNSAGLVTGLSPAMRILETFPELTTLLFNTTKKDGVVLPKTASLWWVTMVGHQTKTL
ncbi:hypothetical protein PHMEG_00034353, partial [Phytophthora megakarya]